MGIKWRRTLDNLFIPFNLLFRNSKGPKWRRMWVLPIEYYLFFTDRKCQKWRRVRVISSYKYFMFIWDTKRHTAFRFIIAVKKLSFIKVLQTHISIKVSYSLLSCPHAWLTSSLFQNSWGTSDTSVKGLLHHVWHSDASSYSPLVCILCHKTCKTVNHQDLY